MVTKLRIKRLELGLRQTDVAEMTEGCISQHRLSLLERGVFPSPDEAKVLADAFKASPEELFQA